MHKRMLVCMLAEQQAFVELSCLACSSVCSTQIRLLKLRLTGWMEVVSERARRAAAFDQLAVNIGSRTRQAPDVSRISVSSLYILDIP